MSSSDPILSDYITENELLNELGLKNVRTLRRWRADRIGPRVTRIGRKFYYRRSTVATWIAAQEQGVA